MEHKREFLLLASYCGDDKGANCTEEKPCADCLAMCNVFTVPAETDLEYDRVLGEVHCIKD